MKNSKKEEYNIWIKLLLAEWSITVFIASCYVEQPSSVIIKQILKILHYCMWNRSFKSGITIYFNQHLHSCSRTHQVCSSFLKTEPTFTCAKQFGSVRVKEPIGGKLRQEDFVCAWQNIEILGDVRERSMDGQKKGEKEEKSENRWLNWTRQLVKKLLLWMKK